MATHYIDLTVVRDAETAVPALLGVLYDKLHQRLVQLHTDTIGVSFPHYELVPRTLGDTLRIHGPETALQALLAAEWLGGMRDYVHASAILVVPVHAQHRLVTRRQFKTNVDRMRRRRMRRKQETAEQATLAIPDTVERTPNLPYVHLRSLSTGQGFCLFVSLGPLMDEPIPGRFNTYGLSQGATVPWF
jgi:CRISPR-associated endonuclease Csy4